MYLTPAHTEYVLKNSRLSHTAILTLVHKYVIKISSSLPSVRTVIKLFETEHTQIIGISTVTLPLSEKACKFYQILLC